ncbi:sugar ABC transporter substrate-binding protein [Labrys wisconsinensis]|uniref:Simple sugar transport system substrate-binding protein n=1 Tax=Labrys wisconsinensis TaxID=425677 RepID=A0ABU0JDH1_9HYPH|nr:sugar ABC transporter substrate-binding protein [Labrys wisconsinensis]MDQ0471448.1 simple sugar transport system substrate-binding protein [Labrys wisconsinensis]
MDDIQDQAETTRAGSGISRRTAFTTAAKLGLGIAGLAGGLGAASAEDAPQPTGGLPRKAYKFHFVCHVTLDQFFTPTIYGIQDACAAFGCSYQWTGSQKNVVSEMVSAMQTAIAQKSDGIAVCLVDPKAFDAATAMASAAGIPVIAFNADVPAGSPNKRLSYVGQPLYQSGYNSALKWLKLVPKGGHVMLSIGVPGSLNTQPRLDGYIQAIKDHGDEITYDVVNTGPDPATEISRVESYYLSHKTMAGMFGTGGSDTYACGFVANKYGLAKTGTAVAGFDLFPQTLGFIKAGDVAFTTDQQAYLQGFLPVQQMYLYKLSGGLVGPANSDTSQAYVTKDNVDAYVGQTRFEGRSTAEPT